MKQTLLFIASTLLLLTGAAQAASVKTYGAVAQADLTVLPRKTPSFTSQLCMRTQTAQCTATQIAWSQIQDDGRGNVKDPGNGTMNKQGWLIADQIIKISNIIDNDAGWVLQIHTDNIANGYNGPFKGSGTIAGLLPQSQGN